MRSGIGPEQTIADVLDSLQQSRELLLDPCPQNIDHCRMMMGQCAERFSEFLQQPEFAPHAADRFIADIRLVKAELASISGLLTAAAAFRRDMLKAMRGASTSVTPCAASPVKPRAVIPIDAPGQKAPRVHMLC